VKGKGSRDKGARGEREITALLNAAGIPAERIARTGYSTPDVYVLGRFAEVKRREQEVGIKDYQWLEDADILFKRRNNKAWLVTMDLDTFEAIVKGGVTG